MALISIIVVTYNAATKIVSTLDSIFLQDCSNYEVILIDGGSNDSTIDNISKYKSKISYFISEPDNGIYDAMNKGISVASGVYTMFLNAGDSLFNAHALSSVIPLIADCEYDIYACNARYFWPNGNEFSFVPQFNVLPYVFCHQSLLFRTSVLKLNQYNTNYKLSGDSELLYRLLSSGSKLLQINLELVREEAGDGVTYRHLYKSAKELYSIPYISLRINKWVVLFRLMKIGMINILLLISPKSLLHNILNRHSHA